MKVYFVRHGESEYNAKQLFQHKDVFLSDNGKKQAKFLARRFSKIPVDIIVYSSYVRAKETTQIIAKKIKKEIIYSDLIIENVEPKEIIGKYISSKKVVKIKKGITLCEKKDSKRSWELRTFNDYSHLG